MCFFFLFKSTTEVMKADAVFSKKGVKYEILPVPKKLSSECGLCVKACGEWKELLNVLLNEKVKVTAVYDEGLGERWKKT